MIQKFIETQWNKEGIACEGGEGVPEVAARRDWDDYRTVPCGSAWSAQLVCTSMRCRGRELVGGGPPTSIPQGPVGPGLGESLSRGRRAFSLHKCAIRLPSLPRVGAHSKSHMGAVLTRGRPGSWRLECVAGIYWVMPRFMVRTRSFRLYFVDNQGVIKGDCLITRTKIL